MNIINGCRVVSGDIGSLLAEAEKMYGEVSSEQFNRAVDVVTDFLSKYPRVCAMRVDLHFPQMVLADDPDVPTCFPRTEPKVITRFFESLKSQLLAAHRGKGKPGGPDPFGYIWVKEQVVSASPHYHVVLLFNKDVYAYLGNYADFEAVNMATRIRKAWCSALKLPFPDYAHVVHFPESGVYWIERHTATMDNVDYRGFLLRIAYLFKFYSKAPGERNFGCSLPVAKAGI
ncbi:MAG: inovirus Gp2 family protein [Shewanella sp.]